jgi:hypothetical protein
VLPVWWFGEWEEDLKEGVVYEKEMEVNLESYGILFLWRGIYM